MRYLQVFFVFYCCVPIPTMIVAAEKQDPFSVFADPKAKESDLVVATDLLGPVTEAPSFWTKIANSTDYSNTHRRLCVFQLFRRHVRAGISLGALATLLDKPTWIGQNDVVRHPGIYTGPPEMMPMYMKVEYDPAEITKLIVDVFPGQPSKVWRREYWRIILAFTRDVSPDNFLDVIVNGKAHSDISSKVLMFFSLLDDDGEELHMQNSVAFRAFRDYSSVFAGWNVDTNPRDAHIVRVPEKSIGFYAQRLKERVTFVHNEGNLGDGLRFLEGLIGIPFIVDVSLESALEHPLRFSAQACPLDIILRDMLKPVSLDFELKDDGIHILSAVTAQGVSHEEKTEKKGNE